MPTSLSEKNSVPCTDEQIHIEMKEDREISATLLECISEPSGISLKVAIELEKDEEECEAVYDMSHNKTKKVYEVFTKLAGDYKIAVVKDQSVYKKLVKEKMLERYLRMLLASISHEIRNPLNTIEGYLTIMLDTNESTEVIKEFLLRLRFAAQHIDYIVNGACYLTITEGGTVVLQPENFAIRSSVEQIVSMMQPSIVGPKTTLEYHISPSVPPIIFSDSKKFSLILYHLLTNAVKYTSSGHIVVNLTYDPDKSVIATSIEDTGCGMSEEKIMSVFKLFSNIDCANEFNPQGMGLGLVLCKRLSKMLGGDISVKSKIGVGSAFTFTIKLLAGNDIRMLEEELPIERKRSNVELETRLFIVPKREVAEILLQKRKEKHEECGCSQALVVDDEPSNRLVIKAYLKSLNVRADEAENGLVALEKVTEKANCSCCKHYKLITIDINMPVMDGTTATKKLIEMFEKNKELKAPIIAITAANLHSRQDIQTLLSVGFVDICMESLL